jgi:hypothetical protein
MNIHPEPLHFVIIHSIYTLLRLPSAIKIEFKIISMNDSLTARANKVIAQDKLAEFGSQLGCPLRGKLFRN